MADKKAVKKPMTLDYAFKGVSVKDKAKIEAMAEDNEFIASIEKEYNIKLPKNVSPQRLDSILSRVSKGMSVERAFARFGTKSNQKELGLIQE